MKISILASVFWGLFLFGSYAQDTTHYRPNKINDFSFIPLPAIASNPANGWLFGVAPSASWYLGNPENTKISNLVGNFLYTTKKQWIFSSRSSIFLDQNQWILFGDWRYFITSQPTFGLGSNTPNTPSQNPYQRNTWWGEQQMDFRLMRVHETVFKRIQDSQFYLGMGYHLDRHTKIKNYLQEESSSEPVYQFSHDSYNQKLGFSTSDYTLSGISLNVILENRDNSVSPYERNFAWVSYKINPDFLGSEQNSSTLLLDYRHYINLNPNRKRELIAIWGLANFQVSGNLAYMNLPALGWDMFGRAQRGFFQGRFRGENMLFTEAEYRFPLQKNRETFGGTLFINSNSFSSKTDGEKLLDKINLGYGLGLRIMINPEKRTTIAADYGLGSKDTSGFYLNINETF